MVMKLSADITTVEEMINNSDIMIIIAFFILLIILLQRITESVIISFVAPISVVYHDLTVTFGTCQNDVL